MAIRVFEVAVRAPVEAVWEFHASVEALRILTPPDRKVELLGDDLAVRDGALHVIRVRQFGLPLVWKARISEVTPPTGFTDTAEQSPFAEWRHRHDFLPTDDGTLIRDTVQYRLPLGPLGELAGALYVHRQIEQLFAFRHEATRRALEG